MFPHTPSIYGGQLVLRFRPHHPSWLDKRSEMTKMKSRLVKNIEKLERWDSEATEFDVRNETAPGDAALTLEHIEEIIYEAMIRIEQRFLDEEEDDEE